MTDDELDCLCLSTSLALQVVVEHFEDWVGNVLGPLKIKLEIEDALLPWIRDLPERLEAEGVEGDRRIASTRVNLQRWRGVLIPMFPDLGSYRKIGTEGTDAIDDLSEILYELERACVVLDHAGERACCGYLRLSHRTNWGRRWDRLLRHIARESV